MKRPLFWIRLVCIFLFIFAGLFTAQEGIPSKAYPVGEGITLSTDSALTGQVPAHPIILHAARLPCEGTPEPGAQLLVLQQGVNGYAGAADTTLARYDGNLSTQWFVRVGYKRQNNALIRFDLASIPPGSRIICAALSLYAEMWSGSPFSLAVGAYAVKRPWVAEEATWYLASATVPWQIGGCNGSDDRAQTPETVVTIQNIRTWYHFDLTQLVGGWVNGTLPNYGVTLQALDELDLDLIYFAASDDVTSDGSIENRPKLVILYVPPPTPTATSTASPTLTTTPTETSTPIVLPTETATPTVPIVPTDTATPTTPAVPTETATPTMPVVPTETPTPTAPTETATPTPIPVTPTAIPTISLYQLFAPVIWHNYPMRCLRWGYTFAEEFDDPAISSWSGSLNGGHQEVSGGVLHQWTQPSIDRFPLLWSNSLFADAGDNFTFEVRFRYSNFAAYGTTIALNSASVDGSRVLSPLPLAPDMEDVLNIHHVVDEIGRVYRFDISLFKGRVMWIGTPGDTNWHEVRITVENGEVYTLYVDGLRVGSIRSTKRPTSMYIGNPTIQPWPGAWTQLYIDYVRISRCTSWGLD